MQQLYKLIGVPENRGCALDHRDASKELHNKMQKENSYRVQDIELDELCSN